MKKSRPMKKRSRYLSKPRSRHLSKPSTRYLLEPTFFTIKQLREAPRVSYKEVLNTYAENTQLAKKPNLIKSEMLISDKRKVKLKCEVAQDVRRHNLFKSGNGSTLNRKPTKRTHKKCQ